MSFADALEAAVDGRVIAVATLEDPRTASSVAAALYRGGIGAMELTLRTPTALESLRAIRGSQPEMIVGAGTVLTPEQVALAHEAGAQFAVAPGTSVDVLTAARKRGLPFAPGVATPSDIETALRWDCTLLKFFPAEPLGGLTYLRAIAAPYLHRHLRFVPLGGLKESHLLQYLTDPLIAAVGGSWLVPSEAVRAADWEEIERRARIARRVVAGAFPADDLSLDKA